MNTSECRRPQALGSRPAYIQAPPPLSSAFRVLSTPRSSQALPEGLHHSSALLTTPGPTAAPSFRHPHPLCHPSPVISHTSFGHAFPFSAVLWPPPTCFLGLPNCSPETSLLRVTKAKRGFPEPCPCPLQPPCPALHPRSPIPPL